MNQVKIKVKIQKNKNVWLLSFKNHEELCEKIGRPQAWFDFLALSVSMLKKVSNKNVILEPNFISLYSKMFKENNEINYKDLEDLHVTRAIKDYISERTFSYEDIFLLCKRLHEIVIVKSNKEIKQERNQEQNKETGEV